MAFPVWPYTNLHDLNLDWILSKVQTIDENVADSKRYAEAAEESATDSENAKTDAETAKDDAVSAKNDAVAARNAAAVSATAAQAALNNIGTATAGAVADWLAAHVDPDTGYVIDDTLTVEQAAADARAVGINVKGLLNFWVPTQESWDWEQGDISAVDGTDVVSATAIRSAVITNPSNMAVFITGLERTGIGDQRFYTAVYDNNDTFQYRTGPYTSAFYGCLINQGWKLRVVLEYDSGNAITPADAPYGFECITLYYTDTDIQAAPGWGQVGKAADSAAVCAELYTLSQAIPGVDNTLSLTGNWAAGAAATGEAIDQVKSDIGEYQSTVKLVKNLVSGIVVGYYADYNASGVIITADANRAYVKIPVKAGRTYSVSAQFSGNFSFWAYENAGTEYGISKISSFNTNYVITAPSNATILYLSNSGWNANTEIVVLETDISIIGAKRADYPFNTVVKIEEDALVDLYNTIDVLGVSRFSKWERGSLTVTNGTSTPAKDPSSTYMNQRICTPTTLPLTLKTGDTLSINGASNITYYVHRYDSDTSTWEASGWITGDYTAAVDDDYWVVIRHADNSTLASMTELSDAFTISRKNGIINNQIADLLNGVPDVPLYYFENDYLPDKVDSINQKSDVLAGVNFVFVTDLHFVANQGNSKKLINYIRKNTSVDVVICGGDFARVYGTATDLQSDYDKTLEYMNYVGKDCFYAIRGNHDFHDKVSADAQVFNGFTWAKTYNAIYRNSEYHVSSALVQHGAYCLDNDTQKTRFVCLNSSDWNLTYDKVEEGVPYISVAQINWFIDALTEKTGWNIIVVSHIASVSSLAAADYASQEIVQTILEALKNKTTVSETYKGSPITADFTSSTNNLICHISGHSHRDGSSTDNNVLSIITTCDALYQDDGYGGTAGTITEQAFDVFCIDYDLETINAVRVGRGLDRNWAY